MSQPADTIMSGTTSATPPKASDSLSFDGMGLDLDRVLAHVSLQLLLYPEAFAHPATTVAFVSAHFRGAARDLAAMEMSSQKGRQRMENWDQSLAAVKSAFGYDSVQVQAIAQTRLNALEQKGDLLEFLLEFDALTAKAGLHADVTKMTLLVPKLAKKYRDGLTMSGDTLSNYGTVRNQLLNMYSRSEVQEKSADAQRSAARCKKCGKRGHTASQCVAKN